MIQTILWGAGGLICALLVILTIRKASFDDGPHWAVVVLILLVGCGAAWAGDAYMKHREAQRVTERILADLETTLPLVGAYKDADPKGYDEIVKAVERSEGNALEDRLRDAPGDAQRVAHARIRPKINTLNDEMLVKVASLGLVEMKARAIAKDGSCDYKSLRPEDLGRDILTGGSVSDRLRRRAVFTEVIQSEPAPSNASSYTREQMKAATTPLMLTVLLRAGMTMEQIALMGRSGTLPDSNLGCRIGIAYAEQVLALPASQAGPMIRGWRSL